MKIFLYAISTLASISIFFAVFIAIWILTKMDALEVMFWSLAVSSFFSLMILQKIGEIIENE